MNISDLPDSDTPWTSLKGVKSVMVGPIKEPIVAKVMVSGSKSVSNRALILAAMATGESHLSGLLRSDDTWWCADALRRLGAEIDFEGTDARISGIGQTRPKSGDLHVGSAGTISRFLPPMLVAGEAGQWKITASKQMSKRPVGPLFDALRAGGAKIECSEQENCFPAILHGNSFKGGKLSMSGAVSSQFISGVLMGAGASKQGVDLVVEGGIVQSEYVQITLDVMRHFGAEVSANGNFTRFEVAPTGYVGKDLAVEADASTATYFAALAAVTQGRITLLNLGKKTRQPDYGFMEILERMGASVKRGEVETTIEMKGKLKGGFEVDMRPLSDATLTLAAIAPFADGPVHMHSVAHIRHHECDRISAMCQSLAAVGIKVEEHEDGLTVYPGVPKFGILDTFEDHRMAMSLAVLGIAGAGVELLGPGCVSKTCPSFFEQLAGVGAKISEQ
ncbi:MAG: 3-phosphoshikimate 1-carboxyvinyltransferase [Devosiaceae bacterium]|nr:3-phosphoshikimate 1-carboxyvinyltransferase [Devosiaceae bacterium]